MLRRLDIRVFVCMLDCVLNKDHMNHLEQVQLKVQEHNGREAIHIVWFGVMQDLRRDADQALGEIRLMDETPMDKLDEVLTRFEVLRNRIPDYSAFSSMEVLRRVASSSVECKVILYAADQVEPTLEVVENVIASLRKILVQREAQRIWKAAHKGKGPHGAPGTPALGGKNGGKNGGGKGAGKGSKAAYGQAQWAGTRQHGLGMCDDGPGGRAAVCCAGKGSEAAHGRAQCAGTCQ